MVASSPSMRSEGAADAASREPPEADGTADQAADASLPNGWTSELDPRYGATYYIHVESGRTQWERPAV